MWAVESPLQGTIVEVGVGLIPGGGGTKEMLARALDGLPPTHPDLLPFVQRVFETIGFAKVSTSAANASSAWDFSSK